MILKPVSLLLSIVIVIDHTSSLSSNFFTMAVSRFRNFILSNCSKDFKYFLSLGYILSNLGYFSNLIKLVSNNVHVSNVLSQQDVSLVLEALYKLLFVYIDLYVAGGRDY